MALRPFAAGGTGGALLLRLLQLGLDARVPVIGPPAAVYTPALDCAASLSDGELISEVALRLPAAFYLGFVVGIACAITLFA